MPHFFVYFDIAVSKRSVEMPYDEDEPAEIKDQTEQFRRDPCDLECMDYCLNNKPDVDCDVECCA